MDHAPILYSFRRCPYAIRARMAIAAAGITVELREVDLKDKPSALLTASPKGTVPVLIDSDQAVIDESMAIMRWALAKADPCAWLACDDIAAPRISECDGAFKGWLDKYKYADRHPERTPSYYRQQAESFIASLDESLNNHRFIAGSQACLGDVAIFPFVRQFAAVDPQWWTSNPYEQTRVWLQHWLEGDLFHTAMKKTRPWTAESPASADAVWFPNPE